MISSTRQIASAAFGASQRRWIASTSRSSRAMPFIPDHTPASSSSFSMKNEPMRLLMLAKPGSGKGTLSGRLTSKYNVQFVSTGDMLREQIKAGTEVGKQAEGIVSSGGLVPDELMIKLLGTSLESSSMKGKSWILDGFPRTLVQGERLDRYLASTGQPLGLIVHLDVPDEIIMGRISDRWIHPSSGRIYNNSYNRPKVEGLDDVTGEPLVRRADDNPEIFARRLKSFYAQTAPLLEYYQSTAPSNLVTLSGKTSDEIWPQLESLVRSRFSSLKSKTETKRVVPEAVIRRAEREISRDHRDFLSSLSPIIPTAY
ncbi:hypothetical protein FRC01_005303 [Tulasnella sp. 417]|nr:hypothetical protein FRC01_005303 [Tulasnella sp. 417]